MLLCEKLKCTIGQKCLFNNLSFLTGGGSLIIVNGSNGSGKTSFLKILAGLLEPCGGVLEWFEDTEDAKNFSYNDNEELDNTLHKVFTLGTPDTFYFGHKFAINEDLTVIENLRFWAHLNKSELAIQAALTYFKLENILQIKCAKLSHGLKKRVGLARSLLNKSNLWLLDEPFAMLDSKTKEILIGAINSKCDNGGIVFITTNESLKLEKMTGYLNIEGFK